jgi:hypothetical protein
VGSCRIMSRQLCFHLPPRVFCSMIGSILALVQRWWNKVVGTEPTRHDHNGECAMHTGQGNPVEHRVPHSIKKAEHKPRTVRSEYRAAQPHDLRNRYARGTKWCFSNCTHTQYIFRSSPLRSDPPPHHFRPQLRNANHEPCRQ